MSRIQVASRVEVNRSIFRKSSHRWCLELAEIKSADRIVWVLGCQATGVPSPVTVSGSCERKISKQRVQQTSSNTIDLLHAAGVGLIRNIQRLLVTGHWIWGDQCFSFDFFTEIILCDNKAIQSWTRTRHHQSLFNLCNCLQRECCGEVDMAYPSLLA